MTKTCTKCKETKSVELFYKSKKTNKIDYYCKTCRVGTALNSHRNPITKPKCSLDGCDRFHYAKNMCRVHYARTVRHGSPELKNTRTQERYTTGTGRTKYATVRKNHLSLKYKLTEEQYAEMAKNGCEICGKAGLAHKKLHVDHDHKCCPVYYTDKGYSLYFKTCGLCVRGVLCDGCNQAVGKYEKGIMREDYPLRNQVIAYVAKYSWLISDRMVAYDKQKGQRKG
jgi:hypothetical protein